ncbi:AraC-like DNA-binding protein [Chitinivorax tropicus]|uniref:AraC-like DNA-binding protein n=1 Tax=Chitinivorax tropicus TaxID=714531 RepID=A0A840MR65_9PROT|nr:AraC family transcriptional regulator [Chitinivorax tropicus]MBB5017711.1 AraC-like DNA-binding protein [Chitinivorax tropicus]
MLGLILRIDHLMTAELAMELDEISPLPQNKPKPLYSTRLDDKLEDCTLRLLEALTTYQETRLLGPSILRELVYRVLTGEQGGSLRAALSQGGHFNRIAKALRQIHAQYEQTLNVAALAEAANMSVPAFHAHFKAVTSTSPIQYIKAIRLHQARLMMIRNGTTAAAASVKVGYESASQFSREFKRLFGRSPTEEVQTSCR